MWFRRTTSAAAHVLSQNRVPWQSQLLQGPGAGRFSLGWWWLASSFTFTVLIGCWEVAFFIIRFLPKAVILWFNMMETEKQMGLTHSYCNSNSLCVLSLLRLGYGMRFFSFLKSGKKCPVVVVANCLALFGIKYLWKSIGRSLCFPSQRAHLGATCLVQTVC